MKKSFSKLLALILILCAVIMPVGRHPASASAATEPAEVSELELRSTFVSAITDYIKFTGRIAGSEGEREAAEYIISVLGGLPHIEAAGIEGSERAGVQKFPFTSIFDGKHYDSQNLIFDYHSEGGSGKKVILSTNYDSFYLDSDAIKSGESFNGSAAGVAFLLTLASYLPELSPNFDVELVFFGAGESNGAGAKFYTSGISAKERENILLAVNLDKFAIGRELYFYVDEVETKLAGFAAGIGGVKNVDISHLGKIMLEDSSELGLNYTHIAQNTNNLSLMKSGVLTMNIFAGDYSSGLVLGRSEFDGQTAITYTGNDTAEYVVEKYGEKALTDNMVSTFSFISKLFSAPDFVSVCEASAGETAVFYSRVTNEKLIVYLTACAFVLMIIIAVLIYYKLSVKAYFANVETEFTSSVLNISENISDDTQNIEVPKAVSQIIANDIKKDKKIKKKK